jgi:hypothetical protein
LIELSTDWDHPRLLEERIFGTADRRQIAAWVDGFCQRSLGAAIEE